MTIGDSDDFKMLSLQQKNLIISPHNHQEIETPPNHSQTGLVNDGTEHKKNTTDDEIDVVMSNDENLQINNTNVDNDDCKQGMILVFKLIEKD